MGDIQTIKQKFVDVLDADATLGTLLGVDAAGNKPIYQDWQWGKHLWLPCVTVSDATSLGEIAGLNDAYDGANRYEWDYPVIQVDVWAKNASQRDQIGTRVRKTLLKALADFRTIGASLAAPSVMVLYEKDRLIWRLSLRYPVFHILEVAMT